ncbi:crt homolog 1-like [Sycon ciliatum]|uniref:crt homolog 1-like n=1 Tax=Sycon ciliatum TaxID=27933 RepID=UPI0020ADC413|eukprot:scpid67758/ scgid10317/ 
MDRVLKIIFEFCTAVIMSLSYGFMITYLVLWGRAMPEHAYFMLLFVAVFTTIVALLVALARKIWFMVMGGQDCQTMSHPINRTYMKFPVPQLIGFLLMLNYVTAGFGSPHVSGILQAILTQGSIPFTIVMSYVLLKRRYTWLQLGGAAVVIGGALLSMEKDFKSGSCDPSLNSTNATDFMLECHDVEATLIAKNVSSICIGDSNSIAWDFLYFLSTLPIGLVNIINEYFLQYSKGNDERRAKAGELNIAITVALNNIWLFFWLLVVFWLNLLPNVVPQCADVGHNVHVLGENMKAAFQCTFAGHGGFTGNVTNSTLDLHFKDHCDIAMTYVALLAVAASVQMIFQAYTVQQQSATFTMALVTLGPMFAVFFQNSKGITGDFHEEVKTQFTAFMTAGLVVVLLGILLYKTPEVLRFAGVASSQHPIETDDSESWIHKRLSRVLKYYIREALRTYTDSGKGEVQALQDTASPDDGPPGCCL